MAPTWLPKSIKIHEKSMPRCLPIMTSFFDRFLIDFCSQLGPPNPENSRPHSCESTIFLKSHFDVHMDFWFDFGANRFDFGSRNPPKSYQKSIPRCIKILIDFCIDFLSILAPTWDPSWGHVGNFFAQNGARESEAALFFVGSILFSDFWALRAPCWRHLSSIYWVGAGFGFGGF